MTKRKTAIIYESFYDAISGLEDSDFVLMIKAYCNYALNGSEPQLSGYLLSMWKLIKPIIDKNNQLYENGSKGGRKSTNQTGTKVEPTENQTGTNVEPTPSNDVDEDVDKDSLSLSREVREEEREKFFEIFFFRNFRNPAREVDRFVNHYQATGWMRKGERVVDKAALAKAWAEEKTTEPPRYPVGFLQCWREIYDKLSAVAVCRDMLTDLRGVEVTRDRLTLTVSSRGLATLIEGNISLVKPILDNHYPGRTLHYRVPKGM